MELANKDDLMLLNIGINLNAQNVNGMTPPSTIEKGLFGPIFGPIF